MNLAKRIATRLVVLVALVSAVASGVLADEEDWIVEVPKPVTADMLRDCGFLFLADLGDSYLIQGDQPALERLAAARTAFRRVVVKTPGEEIFLLRPNAWGDVMPYACGAVRVGRGQYLVVLGGRQIDGLRAIPWSKARLLPTTFPVTAPRLRSAVGSVSPRPDIAGVLEAVSGDTLWKYISQLSGREPVLMKGVIDTLSTRYSHSWRIDHAADYLFERFQGWGLDVSFYPYVVGRFAFSACAFADDRRGWVVGSDQQIHMTQDAGLTWTQYDPGTPGTYFWGVCFVDTLKGWITGSGGKILHTSDGGRTWVEQAAPTTATLREVCFLDSLNGWIAGYSGKILTTTDAGRTWVSVPSGVTGDLYGAHFESPTRGWACGRYGVILHWDGFSWSAQTSGTGEYLLDVDFGDENTGWVVGGGRTVLKTTDGGVTWFPQSVTPAADPYFRGACFTDTSNGWVVGLNGSVLHTDDGGSTWEVQETGTLFGLRWVRFVDSLEGWAVGYGCTILHTADGGQTWESQTEGLPPAALIALKDVVATKEGTGSAEQVIICGHFDSTSEDPYNSAPGADDNASGTAAVMEAARILAEYPFERTIKFICFSGEEQGLYGSGEYAGDAKAAHDSIVGVLNFDMIGYVDSPPEDLNLIGNAESEWLLDFAADCAEAYVPALAPVESVDPSMVYSDHASFWKAGYDAILGVEDWDLHYPYYHTTGDTLGHLNKSFATDVTKIGVAVVAELAVPDTASSGKWRPGRPIVLKVHPNPFTDRAVISFVTVSRGYAEAQVYDVQGRLVRILLREPLTAGKHDVMWQGDDEAGARVAAGIYFARVRTASGDVAAKIVVLR